MIAICREVDRETGKIAVYEIKAEVTNDLICKLGIRQKLNPELQYFITLRSRWDVDAKTITAIIGRRNLTQKDVERIGGVIRVM